MQLENCLDAYHLTSTHPSFMNIAASRASGGSSFRNIDIADFVDPAIPSGSYTFANGHGAIWIHTANPEVRPLYRQYDALKARVGQQRADMMLKTINFTVFPNLQFSCNACIQMRVMRPLAVDRTEMRSYCIGPKGEPADQRKLRIHQFEDFFNPTGLATPDDSRVYESVQAGLRGARRAGGWPRPSARAGSGDSGAGRVRAGDRHHAADLVQRPLGRAGRDRVPRLVSRVGAAHQGRPGQRGDGMSPEQALATGSALLYRQGRLLDERRWQDWLDLFTEDCEYWVPAWLSEQRQTEDPDTQVSLIYYDLRSRLADRVWRVQSGTSVASDPMPRTCHAITNIQVDEAGDDAHPRCLPPFGWTTTGGRSRRPTLATTSTRCAARAPTGASRARRSAC